MWLPKMGKALKTLSSDSEDEEAQLRFKGDQMLYKCLTMHFYQGPYCATSSRPYATRIRNIMPRHYIALSLVEVEPAPGHDVERVH